MTRKLVVNQHEHYKILYIGFVTGGDASKETGRAVARIKRSVIKKLNECGELDDVDGLKKWNGKVHNLEFTQEEYEKIEQYLEKFEYRTIFADKVADMFDWFSSAEKEST
jgi:hypothetical protein